MCIYPALYLNANLSVLVIDALLKERDDDIRTDLDKIPSIPSGYADLDAEFHAEAFDALLASVDGKLVAVALMRVVNADIRKRINEGDIDIEKYDAILDKLKFNQERIIGLGMEGKYKLTPRPDSQDTGK